MTAVHISDFDAYCRISFGFYAPLFYAHHLYLNGEEVTGEVTLPSDIIEVSNAAFEGCEGITSVIIPEGVTRIGRASFKSCPNLTSVSLPSTLQTIAEEAFNFDINLTSVIIPEGITTISTSTFHSCTNLESVILPKNLTSIGSYAFFCCSNLNSISIPESVTEIGWAAFQNCYSLTSINLPSGITKIEGYLFCGTPLTSIDIPSNVSSIGNWAFHDCHFSSVTIPENVETIGENAFCNCGDVTSITVHAETPPVVANQDAFYKCYNATLYVPFPTKCLYESADYWKEFNEIVQLEGPIAIGDTFTAPVPCGDGTVDLTFKVTNLSPLEVEVSASPEDIAGALTIPATVHDENGFVFAVKSIGYAAFQGRNRLLAVSLPDNIRKFGNEAFRYCHNLTTINIPDGVESISSGCFNQCESLTDLKLPASITTIGHYAFWGSIALTSLVLPEGLMFIYDNAFQLSGLESIKFPSTLTSVGRSAFQDCKSLKTIDFNGCAATIGAWAFCGSAIEDITVPDNITLIEWSTFYGCSSLRTARIENANNQAVVGLFGACTKLENVVLPSVDIMYTDAFKGCTSLQSVTFESDSPHIVVQSYFKNFINVPDDVLFIIPEGTVESYLKAGFKNLSDKSGLPMVREEFEAEAARIVEMVNTLSDGDKETLNTAISDARSIVNATDDYMTVYAQIAAIKTAAKTYLTTATLPADFDVTAATITNPDVDNFPFGWCLYGGDWGRGRIEEQKVNGDVLLDNYLYVWKGDALDDGNAISQTITSLPAGIYRLEADILAPSQDDATAEVTGVSFFAGTQKTAVATENQKPQHFSIEFENQMTRDVAIGVNINGTNSGFLGMDNVRLYYVAKAADFLLPSHTELASSETDTLYLYNVEDETFLKAGNSWGTHAVLGDEGLPVRLTQDSETGLWQVYFWEGSGSDKLLFREYGYTDEAYVDFNSPRDDADPDLTKWSFTESANGTYLIQNKTLEGTEKFLGNVPSRLDCQNNYSGETHTDVIATATTADNVHWMLMTKKQYDEYQRGLIYQNMLYADETLSVVPEGMATLKLDLKKEAAVNMIDFQLQLPEGISIAENASGNPDITLNSSRSNGHVVTAQLNENGIYHVVCYSSKNGAFKDSDGLLFNIKLQCATDVVAGNYTALLKDILMSDVDKNEITQPDYAIDIEVPDLTLGDVNDDGRINGLDIVEMVDRILQRPSDTFHFLAADLNFDSKINALDLVRLVKLVLNQGSTTSGNHAPAVDRERSMDADDLSLEVAANGALTMGVAAADRLILTQCVVELEEGMQLEGVTTDACHTALCQPLDGNRYAVLVYSARNDAFASNDALLSFGIKGQGHVSVTDVMVVNEQRQAMYLAHAGTAVATGIGNVNANADVDVYDLGGRKYDEGKLQNGKLTRGVYIMNGKKVVVK